MNLGVAAALVSMVSWGIGDFLIQRSARRLGDWKTLFYIDALGWIVLLPLCFKELISASGTEIAILAAIGLFVPIAAILDFEALKKGKIAVVEPIFCLEIPVAAILAFFVLGETVTGAQTGLIAALVVSLALVSLSRFSVLKKMSFLEQGVRIAVLAAISMGVLNFSFGVGAREAAPLLASFFIRLMASSVSFIVLLSRKELKARHVASEARISLPMALFDTVAWTAFAYALTRTPVAIATAFSESYIVIAVLLGIFVSREKLRPHQYLGIVGAVICAVILATTLG